MVHGDVYAEVKMAGYEAGSPILVDSRLEAWSGEACMLTGPSGSGKTVFLLSITGILKHLLNGVVEGEVRLKGLNPLHRDEYARLPGFLGFVMQDPERQIIYPTPLDEAIAVLEARGYSYEEAERKAIQVLDALGLRGKAGEHVENLSGGERKRLAITLSIIHDPDIIILDEPSASLDPAGIGFIRRLVSREKSRGRVILLTEHKGGYFADLVDKAYAVRKRRVVELAGEEIADYEKMPECRETLGSSGGVLLETRGLSAGYREPLVENADIHIRRGEVVALVGPNGSGKSTILKTLAGFLKPLGGEVINAARGLFYAPQNPDTVFIHGSVRRELEDASRRTRVAFEELASMYPWYERVKGLHPLRLSHGQRRWLSILVAYAYGRDLMLLDEPTTGLDHALYSGLVKLVNELRGRGRSILLSTHDPRLVADVADRVYVVEDGRVREKDKCKAVESMYRATGVPL
ncbi:ABC transporter ATP-binding protein [Desulfurococcus mucosus]|uniref:ABC transporter related protein n=1 Tax=Desulfurococcus mucosus (strain ATCC 35584 / DSM 2162 / JCM 9187 / O7/1) TaxID=765177 RepID=E8R7V0_DESM0|nr:ATP-binding cassette domain-containing protein [Desulfurococcus mucosus]ADV64576.1 ABC transporter related protein [Desulfurococcus mucosus DSM 2162]